MDRLRKTDTLFQFPVSVSHNWDKFLAPFPEIMKLKKCCFLLIYFNQESLKLKRWDYLASRIGPDIRCLYLNKDLLV
jgi:hypothetical protein